MSCTIIVGGQFGAEGKGKVVALEAKRLARPFVVRCGGPNSGHSVTIDGRRCVLRQIPAGVVNKNATLLLAPGCAIDPEVLVAEARALEIEKDRLIVDPRAAVVTSDDRGVESGWVRTIASTGTGTGAALMRRMRRESASFLAGASEKIREVARVEPITPLLNTILDKQADVLVEGTQGFGLSLLHGEYPYVTSRDTTASAFASEVGIAPSRVKDVVMAVRTFPIRVGGPSGPLPWEITWEEVRELSGAPEVYLEYTSVTNRLRRVARFDWNLVLRAAQVNRPTALAIMGLDRVDYSNCGVLDKESLSHRANDLVVQMAARLRVPARWVGTGFDTDEAVEYDHG